MSRTVATADAVAECWTRAFGSSAYEENLPFDESGGDSLRILTVVFELERVLALRIPLDILSVHMRPTDLVAVLDRLRRTSATTDVDHRPLIAITMPDRQHAFASKLEHYLRNWFRFAREYDGALGGRLRLTLVDGPESTSRVLGMPTAICVEQRTGGAFNVLATLKIENSRAFAGEPPSEAFGPAAPIVASHDHADRIVDSWEQLAAAIVDLFVATELPA